MRAPSQAELYGKIHTGNPGDVEFYCEATDGTSSVLEIGCGAGRITSAIANRGTNIIGLEINPELADMARELLSHAPHARVLCRDARTFVLPQVDHKGFLPTTVERIIMPYNTAYALGGEAGVLSCLRACRRHLAPEGELWFDAYPIDSLHESLLFGGEPPEEDGGPVGSLTWNEQTFEVFESTRLDPKGQHLEAEYRVVDARGEQLARLVTVHDYLLFHQFERLISEADFEIVCALGSFQGDPWDEDAEQLIFGLKVKET